MSDASEDADRSAIRQALRRRLLELRDRFAESPEAAAATAALASALADVVAELDPEVLGLYGTLRSEFNAATALAADTRLARIAWALPYARRMPRSMDFRRWRPGAPTVADECGIASSDGAVVVPDVVVVPCAGFTAAGHRLGYGGGYYDRWLAAHPQVTAIGVAWSQAEIDEIAFDARPHDIPLACIVTERGVR